MPKPELSQKQSFNSNINKSIIYKLVLVLIVGFLGGWLGARSYADNPNSFSPRASQGKQTVSSQSELISSIAKTVGPSVVSVNVTSISGSESSLFGDNQALEQQSAGTGFIISADGYIVTNRHVIPDGTSKVSVVLSDGTIYDNVSVVGKTSSGDSLDIAFLKIADTKGVKLEPVQLGDSGQMRVGDMSIAIGNALGQFQNTVTSGIISGYGRSVQAEGDSGGVESLQNLFQTDAAINQGNSGGPLVNADGEVIGINTAVAGGGAENIGFAIPINDVKGLIKSVLEKGKLLRPYLGVRYLELDKEIQKQLKLSRSEGAYIQGESNNGVISGSPAEKVGLKNGDIIVAVNGQKIDSKNNLSSMISRYSVGDTVKITYVRGGQEKTVEVKLEELSEGR